MADVPIKKYHVRRARKWLKRTLIPFGPVQCNGLRLMKHEKFIMLDNLQDLIRSNDVPHANWLGRGISKAKQLDIMRSMPYQEV